MRASLAAERIGLRSVTICGQGFGAMAKAVAVALGGREVPVVEYPGVIMTDPDEEFRDKVASVVVEKLIDGLCRPQPAVDDNGQTSAAEAAGARSIAFRGSLDDVQEEFYRRQWTDGLPIVPPTLRRVEEFLRFTDRSPEEVLGVLKPEEREATVWNVAVNGVMAGCRPEFMPVLLAAVEAICEPEFRIQDAGSTPGWEPMVIVSGPIAKELDFNSGSGALRVGRRANSSVGRFLRLYMRNVAGLRIPPGATDKGTLGYTFNVALAENEDAVTEIGWPTLAMDRGFRAGENVVTVRSVVAISQPIYLGGENAQDMAQTIVDFWGNTDLAYWVFTGYLYQKWYPMIVMSPSVARSFARLGWGKSDIKRYLAANSKVSAPLLEKNNWQCGGTNFTNEWMTKEGLLPPVSPDGTVPTILKPEWIDIVVAGDPARNQMRGYMNNHEQGPPITKHVVLPRAWRELLAGGH